jgi:hypothetical protein
MKKLLLIIVLLYSQHLFSQDIIITIGGVQGNRPLVPADFTGKQTNAFDGQTNMAIKYEFKNVRLVGDSVYADGAVINLDMVSNKSWLKNGPQINYLLKHEQGHFDIWLICANELARAYRHIGFIKDEFDNKANAIGQSIFKKYTDLDALYDEETDHSKNRAAQEKWNQFFKDNLPVQQ